MINLHHYEQSSTLSRQIRDNNQLSSGTLISLAFYLGISIINPIPLR